MSCRFVQSRSSELLSFLSEGSSTSRVPVLYGGTSRDSRELQYINAAVHWFGCGQDFTGLYIQAIPGGFGRELRLGSDH